MKTLKHFPVDEWPPADRAAFQGAYEPGDLFDGTDGPGAHLAKGTRQMIRTTYRRWLGFLKATCPDDLSMSPIERITPERVRAFIDHLSAEVRPSTVAIVVARLYAAARLIAPTTEWAWLRSVKSRLEGLARPENRFDRLVPPWQTLNFGIELMDAAMTMPTSGHKQREIQYRDGLLLTMCSIWPIRRRSIAALTVTHHLEFDGAGVNILLHPSDTKAKRAESFRVPEQLVPYLMRYLNDIRPALLGIRRHDGLWASYSARVTAKFGKAMSLHDFRRAAATFLAIDVPRSTATGGAAPAS